jgi:protein TonB
VASKLVLQARTEIDAGRFDAAEALLADARRLDPSSSELQSSTAALNAARSEATQQQRAAEQRAAQQAEAEAMRLEAERAAAAEAEAAKTFAIEATAADEMADEKIEIPSDRPAPEAGNEAANTVEAPAANEAEAPVETAAQAPQEVDILQTAPVAASSLNRIKYVAPRYPRSAQRRNLTGWVEIEFTVDIDGSVQQVSVVNSEPGLTFVNAAVKAVEGWKFEPVVEDGSVVQKRAAVRMMFAVE